MITSALELVTGALGISGVQTGVLAFLGASALYVRKALGLGHLLASWLRTFAVVAVVLVVLLGTGVLEGVDVGVITTAGRTIVDVLAGPLRNLVGLVAPL